jgi:DNA-binding NtrC family response regulator
VNSSDATKLETVALSLAKQSRGALDRFSLLPVLERIYAMGQAVGTIHETIRTVVQERPIVVTDALKPPLAMVERRAIMAALITSSGDKMAAARLLDIGKTTMYRKLNEYGAPSRSSGFVVEFAERALSG